LAGVNTPYKGLFAPSLEVKGERVKLKGNQLSKAFILSSLTLLLAK